ncbi:MAG TPA: peptidylprolyl isomerase [Bacteroidales bacterium]|nr:peptidylprolyl isomerase [Bacteroidales bacterium]
MKKNIVFTLIFAFALSFSWAQKKSPTILVIDGEKISKEEFLSVYNKNNINENSSKESLEEYLDLFINYKLKVKEAERLGYDTIPKLQKELAGYRDQLAEPYLIDEEVNKKLMEEAYERMKWDVRAAHILFRVGMADAAEDTLAAYKKAMEVRKKALEGADFGKLAQEYSEDPSASDRRRNGRVIPGNKGDLGYFTVFNMVYPFESAVYNMEEGDISMPVRTKFGYHLIHLKDKRRALGRAKVAHILLLLTKAESATDSMAVKNKIDSLHQAIENGAEWEAMVKKYSDDKASAKQGGELPWFESNRMIPAFVEATFSLKKTGDISEPFKSKFGWHIVKLIDKEPVGSFEDNKAEIKKQITRNDRADKSKESLIHKIQKEYKAQTFTDNVIALKTVIDSTIFQNKWEADTAESMTGKVYSIGDKSFTQYDFARFLQDNQKRQQKQDIEMYLQLKLEEFIDKKTIAYEDSQLEKKYPDFRNLMQEYRDGILLFELTNDKVWNKAIEDTTGLKAFHEKHKEEYMWEERAAAKIITVTNNTVLEKARRLAGEGKSKEELLETLNDSTSNNVVIREGKFEKPANPYIEKVAWEKGLSETKKHNDNQFFVYIDRFVAPEPKTLDEAKGPVTADYQNYLEKEWIKELRERYDFKVKKRVFKSIEL